MSKIVTMTSTVGELTNGQVYRVRSRKALELVATSAATVSPQRKSDTAIVGKGR
jgi:hypothetical protein